MARTAGAYRARSRRYDDAYDAGSPGVQRWVPRLVGRTVIPKVARKARVERALEAITQPVVETPIPFAATQRSLARTAKSLIRAAPLGRFLEIADSVVRVFPGATEWVHPQGGWTECAPPCSGLPIVAYRSSVGSGCTSCLTLQAIGELPPTQSQSLATTPQNFANRLDYYAHTGGAYPGLTARFDVVRRYSRVTSEATVHGYYQTWPVQYVSPRAESWFEAHPAFDPMRLPIGRFMPTPLPLPVRGLPAMARAQARLPRSPTESSSSSYGRVELPETPPQLALGHRFARPGRGHKERKFVMAIDQNSPLGKALSLVTEGLDVLDCFHKALPKELRAKPKRLPKSVGFAERRFGGQREATPQAKAMAIYRHINSLDVHEALVCIVAENAEDTIFGRAGKHSGEAARRVGRSGPGFQVGPAL